MRTEESSFLACAVFYRFANSASFTAASLHTEIWMSSVTSILRCCLWPRNVYITVTVTHSPHWPKHFMHSNVVYLKWNICLPASLNPSSESFTLLSSNRAPSTPPPPPCIRFQRLMHRSRWLYTTPPHFRNSFSDNIPPPLLHVCTMNLHRCKSGEDKITRSVYGD